MAATIKGLGVIFGVGTQTFTGGIVSHATTAQPTVQSIQLNRTADEQKIKTLDGQVIGAVFSGFMKTASFTFIPGAAASTDAATAFDAMAPVPGTVITLVDTVAGLLDDTWLVTAATQNRVVDQVGTVDIEIEQSEENDITVAIT